MNKSDEIYITEIYQTCTDQEAHKAKLKESNSWKEQKIIVAKGYSTLHLISKPMPLFQKLYHIPHPHPYLPPPPFTAFLIHMHHPTCFTHPSPILLIPNSVHSIVGTEGPSTPLNPPIHFHQLLNWFGIMKSPLEAILHIKILGTS